MKVKKRFFSLPNRFKRLTIFPPTEAAKPDVREDVSLRICDVVKVKITTVLWVRRGNPAHVSVSH